MCTDRHVCSSICVQVDMFTTYMYVNTCGHASRFDHGFKEMINSINLGNSRKGLII